MSKNLSVSQISIYFIQYNLRITFTGDEVDSTDRNPRTLPIDVRASMADVHRRFRLDRPATVQRLGENEPQ